MEVIVPDPVVAHAQTSLPSNAIGIVADWISVGWRKFKSFTA
jgi:hypothetical protein